MFSPSPLHYLFASPLMNGVYRSLFSFAQSPQPERALFPGLVLPLLATIGAWSAPAVLVGDRARRLRWAFALILAVAVLLSLGPYLLTPAGEPLAPLPYLVLYHVVPAWKAMRVPARFALLATLGAATLAALGAMTCSDWVSRRVKARAARSLVPGGVGAILIILLLIEVGPPPLPLVKVATGREIPPAYRWLASTRPGPVLELPISTYDDYQYVYFSTVHWLPLVNGASGFFPPSHTDLLKQLQRLPSQDAVRRAEAAGIAAVVVHLDRLTPPERARWTSPEPATSGLRLLRADATGVVYGVTASLTTALDARVELPDWMPAGQTFRVPVRLRPRDERPWRHEAPHGKTRVVVAWRDQGTGDVQTAATFAQLPLVVLPGEMLTSIVELAAPKRAGQFTVSAQLTGSPSTAAARSIEVRAGPPLTSRRRQQLSARYGEPEGRFELAPGEPVRVGLKATNTGQAIWLARAKHDKGAVRLGWRWFRDGRDLGPEFSGRGPIDYDVFPGQAYRFDVTIPPPRLPGTYRLQLGLVSERVTWFEQAGVPPVEVDVTIQDVIKILR